MGLVVKTKFGNFRARGMSGIQAITELAWTEEEPSDVVEREDVMLQAMLIYGIEGCDIQKCLDAINWIVLERGTPFQQDVWAAVRRIPRGETRSYTQIAEAIGKPKAARAVASAIAKNPLAIYTPCHRVLPADGSIGKFAWGVENKRKMLQHEGVDI